MSTASHWAAPLIGKPWASGAEGPEAYDCRGLVRQVLREQRGIEALPLAPELMTSAEAIVGCARAQGWRPVGRGLQSQYAEWDVVMMRGAQGPHVGVMIRADGRLMLLHAVGALDAQGRPHGEVVCQRLDQAQALGFGRFEFWRKDDAGEAQCS